MSFPPTPLSLGHWPIQIVNSSKHFWVAATQNEVQLALFKQYVVCFIEYLWAFVFIFEGDSYGQLLNIKTLACEGRAGQTAAEWKPQVNEKCFCAI